MLFAFGGFNYLSAQEIKPELYKAASIPDSLKKDANSVIRYAADEVIYKEVGKLVHKRHRIITILNEKAEDVAVFYLGYNRKFDVVNSGEMIIYDQEGKQVKKYRKSDMYDRTASDEEGLTDYRYIYAQHTIPSYPITVEFTYEKTQKSYLDLGAWKIQELEKAVQTASYKVLVDPALGFRYKNRNTNIKPVITKEGNLDSYKWEISNQKAFKAEEGVPGWRYASRIDFGSNSFEFDGLKGNCESWKNYGEWQWNLNKDICNLSPERIQEIKQMTDSITSDKAKAKFLYEYMQKNTRYVSIQLGIGGLKPFPATFVDQKKYGDCKALSNYMFALLKAVNIKSYYTFINAGDNEEPADPSFVSDPFNHIILCVPFEKDTTWLECTSQIRPFGMLGSSTENRYGLLITEEGGKLVSTPKSKMDDNQISSEVMFTILPTGESTGEVKIATSGEYRAMFDYISGLKIDQQKQFLIKYLHLKQPSVFEIKHTLDKGGIKQINLDLAYENFADVIAGNKQFYKPALFNVWNFTLPSEEKRTNDYYFEHPMKKVGKTTINLPEGYVMESMPSNINLKFTYGTYDANYIYDAVKNQVISNAKFVLTNHVIPAAKYNEMQAYFESIVKANNRKLIIKKKV
jgi:hypothetical protein